MKGQETMPRFYCTGFDSVCAPTPEAAAKAFALIAARRKYGSLGYCASLADEGRNHAGDVRRFSAFIGLDKEGGCTGVDHWLTVIERESSERHSIEMYDRIVIEADSQYGFNKCAFGMLSPVPSWEMTPDGRVKLGDGVGLDSLRIWRDFHTVRGEQCPPSILRRIRELTQPPTV
jgi:hypothetical protein